MSFYRPNNSYSSGPGSAPSSAYGLGPGEGERDFSLDSSNPQQRQYHSRDSQGGLHVHTEWPTQTYNDAAGPEGDGYYFYQNPQDTAPKYGNSGTGTSSSRPSSARSRTSRSSSAPSPDPNGLSPVSHTSGRPLSPRSQGGGGHSGQRQQQPLSPHEQRLRHLLKLISADMKL